jgi:hypothetical protein
MREVTLRPVGRMISRSDRAEWRGQERVQHRLSRHLF